MEAGRPVSLLKKGIDDLKETWPDEPDRFLEHHIDPFLLWCVRRGASDITFQSSRMVYCEVHGTLYPATYRSLDAADIAYDRSLLASTRALAERVSVRDGKVVADVPYVALDSFETDTLGRIYYRVGGLHGETVSGYDDLPPVPKDTPRSELYPALVRFYHADYNGEPVRIAALLQPVYDDSMRGIALIQVGETLDARRALSRRIRCAGMAMSSTCRCCRVSTSRPIPVPALSTPRRDTVKKTSSLFSQTSPTMRAPIRKRSMLSGPMVHSRRMRRASKASSSSTATARRTATPMARSSRL